MIHCETIHLRLVDAETRRARIAWSGQASASGPAGAARFAGAAAGEEG